MDFERLERAWRSDANRLSEAAATYVMEETMDELKRRRRGFDVFCAVVGLVLLAVTARVGWAVVFDPFAFDWSAEWGSVALLILPWAALFVLRAMYGRHLRRHPDPYASMPSSLRALIDENAVARQRAKVMAVIVAVSLGVLAVAVVQLVGVGKMTWGNARDGAILFGTVFAVVWGAVAVDYMTRLKPEGARLRRLLAEYEGEPAA